MKNNLKILGIIFSVVLNIVFIGSYVYHKSGLSVLTGQNVNHHRFLYEKLNVSREQLDKLRPLRNTFHTFLNQQGRKIKVEQLELIDLLAKKNPDRSAIAAKQEEIQALQREMQTNVINHLMEGSRIFTPKQREKFFALIRRRIEGSRGSCPRWMPQKKKSPSKGTR